MTDWAAYLKCDGCLALQGEPCRSLSAGGPEALPQVELHHPHRARKLSGTAPRKVTPQSARKSTASPVRRAARKTASRADAWQALAAKQQRRRDG